MKSFVQRAFPLPRVLVPARVSIDIADGSLRHFEFSQAKGQLRPKSFGITAFPHIHITAMTPKSREEAVAALKSFSESEGVSAARIVVHEGEAYVFRLTVPTIERTEIHSAIEALLEENVPIPPSEAVFEYTIVRIDTVRRETVVAVSVVSAKSLSAYIDLFMAAGIRPVSLETSSRALARALFAPDDAKVHAVLDIDSHHSTVFIVQAGAVSFSSSIEIGSEDIVSVVAKTFAIMPEAARKMIDEQAFSHDKDDMKLFDAMIPALSTIRDELSKILVYWKATSKKEKEWTDVSDIVLAGSFSAISGLSKYISITTHLPAVVGSVWTRTAQPDVAVPDLSRKDSLDYGTVIGALL